MHKKYGPIIRINPDVLCINDPEAYNEIYVTESKRKTNNHQPFSQGIGFDGSHFLTTDHDLHRRRRKPLEPFFSRSGILRLQPLLAETIEKLSNRFEHAKGTGTVIRLDHAFFALSGDVVGKLCWAEKDEFLDDADYSPRWYNLVHSIIKTIYLFQMFPWLARTLNNLPKSMMLRLVPQAQVFEDFDKMTLENVAIAKSAKVANEQRDPYKRRYPSLFHWIVNSDMPESELADNRLANEAQVILSAGSTSTARTLTHITCHVLANPRIECRLREELRQIMAGWPEKVPSWVELEGVPYLQAVLKEGLRDDSVYHDPFTFGPERWLGEIDPVMLRNFVPFTRGKTRKRHVVAYRGARMSLNGVAGSRNCLGQNLAQAEISLSLAVLFRPGAPRLELYETDVSDTNHVHDYVVPLPRLDTKGVRVTVH
ncbi:MAG: hypothetical protein Q9222_005299 [Ikaeria aurantiellina]